MRAIRPSDKTLQWLHEGWAGGGSLAGVFGGRGRLWILAVCDGGCSATVELVLAFRARASSDLIISRHLAGKERVLSLHYDSTTT
jgi:hypothetical protein